MTTNNTEDLLTARNHASYELFIADCKIDLAITEHLKAALALLDGIPQCAPVAQELRATLATTLPPRLSHMLQDACADQ